MTRIISLALGAAALLACMPAAEAQIGRSGGPLDVQAQNMDVFDAEGRILLRGEVDVIQGDTRLAADQIEIFYTPGGNASTSGGFGDINRIVATGDVFYVTPLERARGNRGVYEAQSDTVTLTGDVVLTRGENVITTSRFVTNLTSGNSSFDGQETGDRTRALLFNGDTTGGGRPSGGDAGEDAGESGGSGEDTGE